jgi:excisionase family DNA binding protein
LIHTKALYRISEALALLSIGRTMLYQELRAGRLASVGHGRARRIPATAIDDYLALLEREAASEVAA